MDPRNDVRKIIDNVINRIDPSKAVKRFLSLSGDTLSVGDNQLNLGTYGRITVIATGKGACAMAQAAESILADRIDAGLACTKYGHAANLKYSRVLEAAHPIPDEQSIVCANESLALAGSLGADDLLLVLISGGGSAIWCSPVEGLTLMDKRQVTDELLSCGATIHEINTVRKHLSRIKGGQLAVAAHPARVVTLALSDVIGDDLTSISSGPTVPDRYTFRDALNIINEYGLSDRIPPPAFEYLKNGHAGLNPETAKPFDESFSNDIQVIIGSNRIAVDAARETAESIGYNSHVVQGPVTGEAREAAINLCQLAKGIQSGQGPVESPAVIIAGGETTVAIKGDGRGGRNQEMALAAAIELESTEGITFVSFGTDGNDGPTDAAGGIADSHSLVKAVKHGMDASDYLSRNDSYTFLSKLDDLIVTGPTGSNVMDIQLIFVTQ